MNYHVPWWSEKLEVWLGTYRSKAFYRWYKKTEKQGL